jgi:hypothetical protein
MATTVSKGAENPLLSPKRSLWQRILLNCRLRFFKALVAVLFKLFNLPGIRNEAQQPTYKKVYPCTPTLTNRVFIPKSYKDGDILPLYLDIQ